MGDMIIATKLIRFRVYFSRKNSQLLLILNEVPFKLKFLA